MLNIIWIQTTTNTTLRHFQVSCTLVHCITSCVSDSFCLFPNKHTASFRMAELVRSCRFVQRSSPICSCLGNLCSAMAFSVFGEHHVIPSQEHVGNNSRWLIQSQPELGMYLFTMLMFLIKFSPIHPSECNDFPQSWKNTDKIQASTV